MRVPSSFCTQPDAGRNARGDADRARRANAATRRSSAATRRSVRSAWRSRATARSSAAPSTGLETLAAYQAPNGQIPKFVAPDRREADFWYLGCIDSTLWWLIALALLDERLAQRGGRRGLLRRYRREVSLALQWLGAQEHQRFFLLQQNEASDWADIMPRSGFVLYTNALWYRVKRLFGLPNAAETRANFNGLFHPFSAGLAEYRRARLLNEYCSSARATGIST